MVQRDYARSSGSRRRQQQQGKGKKKLLLALIVIIVVAFAIGLFFLKESSPVSKETELTPEAAPTAKKSTLPSRPEEVWSYIKQLETREVPVDDNASSVAKNAQLTEEQKKILLQLEQDKLAEQAKQKAEEQARLKAAEQEKLAQTKATSQQQTTTQPKVVEKVEKTTTTTAKTVVTEAKTESESKKNTDKSGRKYGLQCGAFKNKTQAEAMQGRLVVSGFNAFTKSSADWTRVFIGPLDSYNAASNAKSTLGSKGIDCVVIGM
ncbi:cell division protein FtsN [Gallibacterium melopsittaci]|uniref:Cell division protein FtsN n=1 Tax=Gallibacterium melopsittaci TaxID=516063 RepID=A0ABV6HZ18_9PAST